ncbi:MAG: RDD family protein [Candidatus Binatia bacterium]
MERRLATADPAAAGPSVFDDEWEPIPDPPATEPSSAPPQKTESLTDTHYRAGFWLRFVAFTIDTVILVVFSLLLLILGLVLTTPGGELSNFDFEFEGPFALFPLWFSGVITATAAYFTILHSEYGQTIGKSLLGLEVCTPDGEALSYSQALFRWLAYGASAVFLGFGFLWIAFNPGKRGWHDLLANTVVVTPKEEEQ